MADEDEGSFKLKFRRDKFVALVGNIPVQLLKAQLAALPLSAPIADARMTLVGDGVIVEWIGELPTTQDRTAVREHIEQFAGGVTTSQPFSVISAGVTTAANATPVSKIDFTSPPLDDGTVSITFTGQHRLQSAAVGDSAGLRLTITFSGFAPIIQEDEWPFMLKHAHNYAITAKVTAGQTVRVQAEVYKLGAGAAIAEASKERFTIDQLYRAAA